MSANHPQDYGAQAPRVPQLTGIDAAWDNPPVPTAAVPRPEFVPLATRRQFPQASPCDVPTKDTNPKDAIGSAKLSQGLVPSTAPAYLATAFTEGALKYGSYNWRVAGVRASIYKDAADRHIAKWWNGEDHDPKTRVHHLANAMACFAIILDADVVGKLTDDRPPRADIAGLIERLEATTAHLKVMSEGLTPKHNYAKHL